MGKDGRTRAVSVWPDRTVAVGSPGHDLLSQAVGGDRSVLKGLLARHGPAVRRRFLGKIPARWQAVLSLDDLMQQTYTDAFLNIGRFVPADEGSFAAWLSRIARNNLSDTLRNLEADKRGKDHRQVQPAGGDESFAALHELVSSGGTSPSGCAARGEARAALEQAIQRLPEAYRRVVQMFDLEGRPMEEVAGALKRSPGATYMLRARAHRRLSELLGSPSNYLSGV